MTTIHLSRDERVSTILQAASEIVMESGVEAATITAIANRSGVSRQWLYDFFPDVNAIFAALYDEVERKYFHTDNVVKPKTESFSNYVKRQSSVYLTMPVAFAMVTSYALNGGARNSESGAALRAMMIGTWEKSWVDPLVEAGFGRSEVFGSILTITNAAVGLNIAINEGLTTHEVAERRLHAIIDAIMGSASDPN
jgi:AcrR family transcriptional regulator